MRKSKWVASPVFRCAALVLALAAGPVNAQTIAVDSFTMPPPETAVQGRKYLIVARVTATDPPAGSSIGFVARYLGADIPDTVSVDSGLRPLQGIEIEIPNRTCFPSLCPDPGPTTVAESLMEVPDQVELTPVMLDAQGGTIATGQATLIPVLKTGSVSVAPASQPLQTRQRIRVTMAGANFTEGAAVFFLDTRDARGSDPIATINWSAGSRRVVACGEPQPIRQVRACDPLVVNDTTFEFTLDTFLGPGDVERYDGRTFDVIASSAAGANVALNAFRLGSQSGLDAVSLEELTISTDIELRQFEPDSANPWNLLPGTPLQVTPRFGYRLETQGTAQLALEVLNPGTGALLSSIPLGDPLPATGPAPRTGREGASVFVDVPDPFEGLEFRLALVELDVPAAAKPEVLSPKNAPGDPLARSASVVIQPTGPIDDPVLPRGTRAPPPAPPTDTIERFVLTRWASSSELDARCEFQADGPLTFDVLIDRYVGSTDAQGRLINPARLINAGVIAPFARLRVAAWDVDFAASSGMLPERDRVRINGKEIGGGAFLQGSDAQWSISEYIVPVQDLFFPELPPAGADRGPLSSPNRVEIAVDTADPTGSPVGWCVAVPWVSLEISAMAPWMLVHGTNAQDTTWDEAVLGRTVPPYLEGLGIPFDHRINLSANGSFERNALILNEALRSRALRFGSKRLHVITHSKGATDTRELLASIYDPDTFGYEIVSLFSLGTPSQGTILSDISIATESVDFWPAAHARASSDPEFADLVRRAKAANGGAVFGYAPVDPARRLQTVGNMAKFNRERPKRNSIPYFSLAGNANFFRDANGNVNDEIDVEELEGFRTFDQDRAFDPNDARDRAIANGAHRMLSRVRSVRLGTMSRQVYTSGFVPRPVTETWTIVEAEEEPATARRLNDLVATTDSVHCTSCGFKKLTSDICGSCKDGIYEENHSSLKRPRIMDLIHDKIRSLFPLANFGGGSP